MFGFAYFNINKSFQNQPIEITFNTLWKLCFAEASADIRKTAEMLMKNSAKFHIELNANNSAGITPFRWTCFCGKTSIVGIMDSKYHKFEFTARDNDGRIRFELAQL